jgi:RsiW-degrading membrane proteinase PrsW (M82 family)
VTVSLFLLSVNRILNLEDWVTVTLRNFVVSQGWYENRRPWQLLFLVVAAIGMAFVAFFVFRACQGQPARLILLTAGWGALLLLGLAATRACSLHHTDQILNLYVLGVHLGGVLELASIMLVALAAVASLRTPDRCLPPRGGPA